MLKIKKIKKRVQKRAKLLFALVLLFSLQLVAQTKTKYEETMLKKLNKLDSTSTPAEIQSLCFDFKRIAGIEKKEWLPYYYAAYCNIRLAGSEKNDNKIDQYLDEARTLCNLADSLIGDENSNLKAHSEVSALKSRIALMKIPVNVMQRGPKYTAIAKMHGEAAIKKNPDNPRAYIVLGMYYLYTPSMFGGDKDKACEHFMKAGSIYLKTTRSKTEPLLPYWGEKLLEKSLMKECEKEN